MSSINLNIDSLKSLRVLVIDDDFAVRTLIEKLLKHEGIENVDTAATGAEALLSLQIPAKTKDFPREVPYDIIILDVVLPDISGFDLCTKIKISFPDLPIMLISGYNIEEIQSNILKCGADDFLSKPFNTFEMMTRVNLLILKNKSNKETETSVDNAAVDINISHFNKIPYIGDRIDDYVILDSLALGKTTIVYKVIDLNTHEILAMKMLTAHSKEFTQIVDRFDYEIKIMSKIDHPSVIRFHDSGTFNGCAYLVMEYLDGVNLEELIISQGRISEQLLLNISCDLADAISAIHSQGIIHRDIKLKNSIFTPHTGRVKLCDFGIAQLPDLRNLTHDGTIVGTPIYMAPENFKGDYATVRSDIYSFGATIYHLATNTPPHVADNHLALYNKHHNDKPVNITKIRPEFSKKWNSIIVDQCLASKPEDRPDSMERVLLELEKIKLLK